MGGFFWNSTDSFLPRGSAFPALFLSFWISLDAMTKELWLWAEVLPFYIGQWVWIKTEGVSSQWPGKHSGPFHQLGLPLPSSSFPAQQQLWELLVHYQHCRQPYSSQWWVTPKATSALQLEEPSSGVDDPTSLGKREEWCVYEFWEYLSSPHFVSGRVLRDSRGVLVFPSLLV